MSLPLQRRALGSLPALSLCMFSASIGTSAVNVALPAIAESTGSFAEAQSVALSYLIAMTATSVMAGYLGDRLGRSRVLRAGALLFALATVGCALSATPGLLIAARAVQGAAAAVMMVLPLAIARDRVPEGRIGAAMGLLGTTMATGTAAGPALGGVLLGAFGWPAIFWAMLPSTLLAVALLPRETTSLTPGSRPTSRSIATPGSQGTDRSIASATRAETRFGLVSTLAPGAMMNLLVGMVMMTTLVTGPFFLTGALGLDATATGIVMAAGPVTSVCAGFLVGRLVDRRGAAGMTAAGLAGMLAGALALALLPGLWGLAGYVCGTVLLAPGYQLFLAANNTAVLSAVPASRRGTASGTLALARNLGLIGGASAMAALFALFADGGSTAALSTALRVTMLTAAALVATGLLISAFLNRPVRPPQAGR